MVGRVKEVGKETFLLFGQSKGFGKGREGHLEKAERVLEHDVSTVDGQGQNLGSVDDLVWYDILFVEFVQDQVRIEALGIVSQDRDFAIFFHFPQPLQEIHDAGTSFKFEQCVAVGGGSTHEIGYVDARVLHGFTVPINKDMVFLFSGGVGPVGFTFSGFE